MFPHSRPCLPGATSAGQAWRCGFLPGPGHTSGNLRRAYNAKSPLSDARIGSCIGSRHAVQTIPTRMSVENTMVLLGTGNVPITLLTGGGG